MLWHLWIGRLLSQGDLKIAGLSVLRFNCSQADDLRQMLQKFADAGWWLIERERDAATTAVDVWSTGYTLMFADASVLVLHGCRAAFPRDPNNGRSKSLRLSGNSCSQRSAIASVCTKHRTASGSGASRSRGTCTRCLLPCKLTEGHGMEQVESHHCLASVLSRRFFMGREVSSLQLFAMKVMDVSLFAVQGVGTASHQRDRRHRSLQGRGALSAHREVTRRDGTREGTFSCAWTCARQNCSFTCA